MSTDTGPAPVYVPARCGAPTATCGQCGALLLDRLDVIAVHNRWHADLLGYTVSVRNAFTSRDRAVRKVLRKMADRLAAR